MATNIDNLSAVANNSNLNKGNMILAVAALKEVADLLKLDEPEISNMVLLLARHIVENRLSEELDKLIDKTRATINTLSNTNEQQQTIVH